MSPTLLRAWASHGALSATAPIKAIRNVDRRVANGRDLSCAIDKPGKRLFFSHINQSFHASVVMTRLQAGEVNFAR